MNRGDSKGLDYNIPSNNRELQQVSRNAREGVHYNIPSNNRELQHKFRLRQM